MSKTEIEVGKTYRARRGRKLYTVSACFEEQGDLWCDVSTSMRGITETSCMHEQEFRDQVRLKGPIEQTVVYLSPSQKRTFRGCKRQWAWQYIDSELEPPKPAQAFGTDTHGVLETYLKRCIWTGPADAVAVAKQGAHLLPQSSPDRSLKIEYPFEIAIFDGQAKIIGVIDLLDPPRLMDPTCEVIDHKTTADVQYIMTPEQLAKDVQANVYSVWAMEAYQIKEVKTSWRYYIGKKNKTKSADAAARPRIPGGFRVVSRIKTLEEVKLQWRGILETAKEMMDLSNNQKIWAADIPGNEFVCQDYGGCSFRHLCERLKMQQNLNDSNNGEVKMTTRNFWDALKDKEEAPATLEPVIAAAQAASIPAPTAPTAQEHPAVTAKRAEKQHAEEFQKAWGIAPPAATPAELAEASKLAEASTPAAAAEAALADAVALTSTPEARAQATQPPPEPIQEHPAVTAAKTKGKEDVKAAYPGWAGPPPKQLTIPSPAAVLQTSKPHTVETLQQNPVNPPPVEQMELPQILQDAQTPTIPQTWIDRLAKGHKARSKKEEEWRTTQPSETEAPNQDEEAFLAMANADEAQKKATLLAQQEMAKIKAAEGTEDQEEAKMSAAQAEADTELVVPEGSPLAGLEITPRTASKKGFGTPLIGTNQLILFVDCLPAKGQSATMLSTALAPLKAAVEKKHGVAFWSLLSYREGDSFLAAYLRTAWKQEKPSGAFLVDSRSAEWRACGDVLTELADVIIRGV